MELEPPYLVREDMPLGPRVMTDHLFEGFAEQAVAALGDSDPALFSLQTTIAENVADGLDARFTSTIGAAEVVNANNAAAVDDLTVHRLVDAGAGTDAYHADVQRYIPQPDAPIEGDFKELPNLGTGHVGGGGVEGGADEPKQEA